jgi:hypothetical protein
MDGPWPFVPKEGAERHNVGLLDRLRLTRLLSSEANVDRRRAVPMLDYIDLFEAKVTLELLEQTCVRVEARRECGGDTYLERLARSKLSLRSFRGPRKPSHAPRTLRNER